MSKFNVTGVAQEGSRSPIKTVGESTTHEGGKGFKRDDKSELFLLASSFMGGDSNFYESEESRYHRLVQLSGRVAVEHIEWLIDCVRWLRNVANMRTAPIVMAIEGVKYRLDYLAASDPELLTSNVNIVHRKLVDVSMARADEPAEALAYWYGKYGRTVPGAVRHGIGDAAVRLWNERSYLRYGASKNKGMVTMQDVLRICRPTPKDNAQSLLFNYITHGDPAAFEGGLLPKIATRNYLTGMDSDRRRQFLHDYDDIGHVLTQFNEAEMSHEILSEWLPDGMDWDLAIPNMGVMALARNLRNFDEAGISDANVKYIQDQFRDSDVIANSRMFPYRWYQAYRAVKSLTWGQSLEKALNFSVRNIPTLKGKTLVLVDMSGSMFDEDTSRVSRHSDILYSDVAKLFGTIWKLNNPDNVDLYQFGSQYNIHWVDEVYDGASAWGGVTKKIDIGQGWSPLVAMEQFHGMGGTKLHDAVAETFPKGAGYNRVIIITDEQSFYSHYQELPVPANVPVYTWNLGGYIAGVERSGNYNRHTFGGLQDSAFSLIPLLESHNDVGWPWDER